MGSKRKYAKDIVPIIQKYIDDNNITEFYDVFCGGGNLVDKIKCENLYASDLSPSLIALHQQAQEDFSKIPDDGSREYWDNAYSNWKNLRDTGFKDFSVLTMPLYEIGAIEWYASFSNGAFQEGMQRILVIETIIKKLGEIIRNSQKMKIIKKLFLSVQIIEPWKSLIMH